MISREYDRTAPSRRGFSITVCSSSALVLPHMSCGYMSHSRAPCGRARRLTPWYQPGHSTRPLHEVYATPASTPGGGVDPHQNNTVPRTNGRRPSLGITPVALFLEHTQGCHSFARRDRGEGRGANE